LAKGVELFDAMAVAAHEVTDCPASGKTDESREQGAEQDCGGVIQAFEKKAVFSQPVNTVQKYSTHATMRPATSSSDTGTANARIRQVIQRFLECDLIVVRHDERSAAPDKVKVISACVSSRLAHNFPIPSNVLDFQKRQRSACICQERADGHSVPLINLHHEPPQLRNGTIS
jgi:hypothetical protein